jgi:hypothetical protein
MVISCCQILKSIPLLKSSWKITAPLPRWNKTYEHKRERERDLTPHQRPGERYVAWITELKAAMEEYFNIFWGARKNQHHPKIYPLSLENWFILNKTVGNSQK